MQLWDCEFNSILPLGNEVAATVEVELIGSQWTIKTSSALASRDLNQSWTLKVTLIVVKSNESLHLTTGNSDIRSSARAWVSEYRQHHVAVREDKHCQHSKAPN